MQHSSMHFRADTVPGGSNMTESVRFHALERSGETADNVLAHGHAAATQPRPAPTSLFDLGQLEVEWEEEMGTLWARSEEHTSELQSLMRISFAGFCLKKKKY